MAKKSVARTTSPASSVVENEVGAGILDSDTHAVARAGVAGRGRSIRDGDGVVGCGLRRERAIND